MIIPGSSYWNLGIGLKPGDILGIATFKDLGHYEPLRFSNLPFLMDPVAMSSQLHNLSAIQFTGGQDCIK